MPYKDKEKQRVYLRDYFKKHGATIKREYRQNKKLQQRGLRQVLDMNNLDPKKQLDLAKAVFDAKPKMFEKTWQELCGIKQTTRKSRK